MVKRIVNALGEKTRKITFLRDTSLMLAMFFLPFGYDALFKLVMEISGSYWVADIVFYSISGLFWLCYIFLTRYLSKKEKPLT